MKKKFEWILMINFFLKNDNFWSSVIKTNSFSFLSQNKFMFAEWKMTPGIQIDSTEELDVEEYES